MNNMDTFRQLNNEGVSLLCIGSTSAALAKFSHCLSQINATFSEERRSEFPSTNDRLHEREFPYKHVNNSTLMIEKAHSEPCLDGFVHNAPILVLHDDGGDIEIHLSNLNEEQTFNRIHQAKLASIVLYNVALAHHMLAIETKSVENSVHLSKTTCNETIPSYGTHSDQGSHQSMVLFKKALVLYRLCRSTVNPTLFGQSTSEEVFQSIVIVNNMGEIHKEVHGSTSSVARKCSEHLVQIFMFYAMNGDQPQMAQELGDILSNAFQTLSGGCTVAPTA